MFDKREAFVEIDKKLSEVRVLCNRAKIPFVWVAAVYNDNEKTEYMAAVDPNTEVSPLEGYKCHTLTPGMYEMDLFDDKIREVIKVLNGCKAVPKDSIMAMTSEDTEVDARKFYGEYAETVKDISGGMFYVVGNKTDKTEKTGEKTEDKKEDDVSDAFENVVFNDNPGIPGQDAIHEMYGDDVEYNSDGLDEGFIPV